MKRAGWSLIVSCFFLLSLLLGWMIAVATPPPVVPYGDNMVRIAADEPAARPVALILIGAGVINLAIWGRKRCRRLPSDTGTPEWTPAGKE